MAFDEPRAKYPFSPVITQLLGYENGAPVFRSHQRVDQWIEEAAYYRNHHPRNGYNPSRTRQYVATIPKEMVEVLMRRCQERGIDWQEWAASGEFVKWLNSEEARPWRTSTGTV